MKGFRIFSIFCLALVLSFTFAFAQVAKIIDIKGDVTIKKDAKSNWQKAKLDILLNKDSQVKTGTKSECTIAFDEELMNVLTIKEKTTVTLESIMPGRVYLPAGRVFALIDNLAKAEEFQVRTPTAIAGARGTGWSTSSGSSGSSVSSFDDTVYVQGLDPNGNVTSEEDLSDGYGLDIGSDGNLGDIFELTDNDLRDWEDFRNNLENIREDLERDESGSEDTGETGSFDDLREEQESSFADEGFEGRREEEEKIEEKEEPYHPQEPPPCPGEKEGGSPGFQHP
jgi:hypothetical protein